MEIFKEKPSQWGLRGDPELWTELEKKFTKFNDPKNESEFNKILDFEFYELLKKGKMESNDDAWFEEFSQSGMSGGYVSIQWWTNTGLPLLKDRYSKTLCTMTSIMTDTLREDFFIKLYFDTKNGFYNAGIKRAFLDFSRTLVIKDEDRATFRQKAEDFLLSQLTIVTQTEFANQEYFDRFHEVSCEKLINTWKELSFGQAQKWINMTLKYWLLFGDQRINGIEKNAKYFHIPIDSYVQRGMFEEKNPKAWSKIDNYQTYFNYQEKHRNKKTGNYPIIDEFMFFNEYNPANLK